MQLKNDISGINLLNEAVYDYYGKSGRSVKAFLEMKREDWNWVGQCFLLEKKHVFRYGIGMDRNFWLGGIELAIGPHYFGPVDFWDYDNAQRFKCSTTIDAIEFNLVLLDEFLGFAK